MRHCAVGVVAGDGAEALGYEVFALAAVGEQHFADLVFGDAVALREAVFQLGEEAAQRDAVLQHGLADVGDFGGAFFGFELGGRIGLLAFRYAGGQPENGGHGNLGGVVHQAA